MKFSDILKTAIKLVPRPGVKQSAQPKAKPPKLKLRDDS